MKLKFISFILSILLISCDEISCDECPDAPEPKNQTREITSGDPGGKKYLWLPSGWKGLRNQHINRSASFFYQEGVLLITSFNTGEKINQGINLKEDIFIHPAIDELAGL